MNKNEYLNMLSQRLSVLPAEEYSNTMQYYTEYFEDAGVENENAVIEELGDVNQLAERILKENGYTPDMNAAYQQSACQQPTYPQSAYQQPVYQQPSYQQSTYQQPIYQQPVYRQDVLQKPQIPTGIKVLLAIVTFPLWVVFISLIFSFGVVSVVCFACSIFVIIAGVSVMATYVGTGFACIGAGFILIAVGIGFLIASKGISMGMKCSFNAIFKRNAVNS